MSKIKVIHTDDEGKRIEITFNYDGRYNQWVANAAFEKLKRDLSQKVINSPALLTKGGSK